MYEDFGLLTCDDEITRDVGDLFNFLTGFARQESYRKLIVSPLDTRRRIIEFIDREAVKGAAGRIDIKVNGLTDPSVIDALYRASQAGTKVRLAVRTLCCLRPGIAGLSENISVRSVVGEFLEHSRVFIFGDWDGDVTVLLGSADLMERNLDRRVEVVVPIEDARLRPALFEAMTLTFEDDCFSWSLGTDRRWRRVAPVNHLSVQLELKHRALERAKPLAV
jgi:polyphosphate kinase